MPAPVKCKEEKKKTFEIAKFHTGQYKSNRIRKQKTRKWRNKIAEGKVKGAIGGCAGQLALCLFPKPDRVPPGARSGRGAGAWGVRQSWGCGRNIVRWPGECGGPQARHQVGPPACAPPIALAQGSSRHQKKNRCVYGYILNFRTHLRMNDLFLQEHDVYIQG